MYSADGKYKKSTNNIRSIETSCKITTTVCTARTARTAKIN